MMQSLSSWDLLTVWEQGHAQPTARQALLLLSAASPDIPSEELAALSVGQRDGRLLALREQLFGSQLNSVVNCPNCSQQLELNFPVSDVRLANTESEADEFSVSSNGYQVRFRLANSLDLLVIDPGTDAVNARQLLLNRCLIEAQHKGEAQTADQLPAAVIEAIVGRMAEADPQAEVQISLNCPACKHEWLAIFDIVSFLWQELTTWAMRTLSDVHELASAYGWRESDILLMSPWRRQLYLQMVHG